MEKLQSETPKANIARTLRRWIRDGVFEEGVPIPSERELCKRLKANQRTLQKAISLLEDEKLIVRKGLRTRLVSPTAFARLNTGTLANTILTFSSLSQIDDSCGSEQTILKSILDESHKEDLHVMMLNPSNLVESIDRFLGHKPFGLFLFNTAYLRDDYRVLDKLANSGIPVVVFGKDERFDEFDRVVSDHAAGAYELATSLYKCGSRKIMMIASPRADTGEDWISDRIAGLKRAERDANAPSYPILFQDPFGSKEDDKLTKELWASTVRYQTGYLAEQFHSHGKPDAIVTLSDGCVFPVASACRILGMEPGRDVEIVGYDNYWLQCPERQFEPYIPKFSVDKRNEQIGREMVSVLVQRNQSSLPDRPELCTIKPELVKIDGNLR